MYKPRAVDLLRMLRQYRDKPKRIRQEDLLRVLVRSTILLLEGRVKREKRAKAQKRWEIESDLIGYDPNE
jgi:hypothetical protein